MRFGMVTTFYPPRHVGGGAVHVPLPYLAWFTTRLAALAPGDDRYALPRLDAHCLRSAALRRRLDSAGVRAWLAGRAALRRLRGHARATLRRRPRPLRRIGRRT